ncbi:MAG: hypothetical protein KW804_00200 [Candidatus Doudnabacteria bacterium]|nr:hypothetical protein [Candidatus Doudnabacteria bacterium]
MILVHDTFVCKPGNASKVAKLFKETMAGDKHVVNILTDMTGQYHRVIMVSQYENLTSYEKAAEEYNNPTPEMKASMEKMKDMNEMYVSGGREMFRVW